MVLITSFIIPAGVDAPATTPTEPQSDKSSPDNSAAVSIRYVLPHFSLHTSNSFAVFELCLPPMTIIASLTPDSSRASCWRIEVALHIVSKISAFVHTFFKIFLHFAKISSLKVVCAAKIMRFPAKFPSFSSNSESSSSPENTNTLPRQCPTIPFTS